MVTDVGRLGTGHQYSLTYDNSTFTTHHRNLALSYVTSADLTVQTFDASAWGVVNAIQFGGLAFIDFPFRTLTQTLAASGEWAVDDYTPGIDLSTKSDGIRLGRHVITVQHRVRTYGIAAESITPGDPIMMSDVEDHITGDNLAHDGMLSPASTGIANEMYVCIGIAETATAVDGTFANHDKHVWNHQEGQFYNTSAFTTLDHGYFFIELWR